MTMLNYGFMPHIIITD